MPELAPEYGIAFKALGDVVNAADAVGDTELAEIGKSGQRLIEERKQDPVWVAADPPPPDPEPAQPSPVRKVSREEFEAYMARRAPDYGLTPRVAVACGVAEGGLDHFAARIGTETDYGLQLLALADEIGIDTVGNWAGDESRPMTGRQAWDELRARVGADISFGPMQETVQHFGDKSSRYENVAAFRAWTITKPFEAIDWALAYLTTKYNPDEADAEFKALCRYNWPAGGGKPYTKGVEANYRNGLTRADAILAAL